MTLFVVGAGPSGTFSTIVAVASGKRVTLVDPNAGKIWKQTICMWESELCQTTKNYLNTLLPNEGWIQKRWTRYRVVTDEGGGSESFNEPYICLDNDAIVKASMQYFEKTGLVNVIREKVIKYFPDDHTIMIKDTIMPYDEMVDCSGARGLRQQERLYLCEHVLVQKFLGITVKSNCALWDTNEVTLMDWSGDGLTFAYILPLTSKTLFIEETVLVCHQHETERDLYHRILNRLRKMGLQDYSWLVTERGAINMTPFLCKKAREVTSHGVCAGELNPITGYSVASAWNNIANNHIPSTLSMIYWAIQQRVLLDETRNPDFFRSFFCARHSQKYIQRKATFSEVLQMKLDMMCMLSWSHFANLLMRCFAATICVSLNFMYGHVKWGRC